MWDALIDCGPLTPPEYQAVLDAAKDRARETERRMRAQLEEQDRLDEAAPELLAACEQALKAIAEEKALQAHRGESVAYALGVAESVLRNAIAKVK